MNKTVPFTENGVKEYLDKAIINWRKILNNKEHPDRDIAIYYCDAFQSVRVSLFGKLLPQEEVRI